MARDPQQSPEERVRRSVARTLANLTVLAASIGVLVAWSYFGLYQLEPGPAAGILRQRAGARGRGGRSRGVVLLRAVPARARPGGGDPALREVRAHRGRARPALALPAADREPRDRERGVARPGGFRHAPRRRALGGRG